MAFRLRTLVLIALWLLLSLMSGTPAFSQDAIQKIEADALEITQSGVWQIINNDLASAGHYLQSSEGQENTLALAFVGDTVVINYMSQPDGGIMAIEIDESVLRTISTESENTVFNQAIIIDYLEDKPHILRVYPVSGVIAVDYFQAKIQPAGSPEIGCANLYRISVSTNGTQSNAASGHASISDDGRYIAFYSMAGNLANSDTNNTADIFVYDRLACTTKRVSIGSTGIQANGLSILPAISGDGHFIAFESIANNLVTGDTNLLTDIFVHNQQTGLTSRVSLSSIGAQADGESRYATISTNGRYIAFVSNATNLVTNDTNGHEDIFVYDQQIGQTSRVSISSSNSQANGASWGPSISADGRYVAFISRATNLVSGDTNNVWDVFVRDRQTNQTSRLSISSSGTQGNQQSLGAAISGNGRYVVFYSYATNLVSGDTNAQPDIFIRDRQTNQTHRVSVASSGNQTGKSSEAPTVSEDGRYVTFSSLSAGLITGDNNATWDIFTVDRQNGQVTRNSIPLTGGEGNQGSFRPTISDDGRNITFESSATNLVSGDTNGKKDTFIKSTASFFAPSPLSATALSNSQIRLNWIDNSSDETRFHVERSVNDITWIEIATIGPNITTYQNTDLSCDITYFYRIRAFRSSDSTYSAYSNVIQSGTLCDLDAPSNLIATPASPSAIHLNWTDNSVSETAFRIERSLDGNEWTEISSVGINIKVYQDEGLFCDSSYRYRVRGYRSFDNQFSAYSNTVQISTLDCMPDNSGILPIEPIGSVITRTPKFSWQDPLSRHWYRLLVKTPAGISVFDRWYQVGNEITCQSNTCTLNATVTLGNTAGNTTLYWHIQPYSIQTGIGELFGPASFTITAPILISPTGTIVDNLGNPTYRWNVLNGATYYRFYLVPPAGQPHFSKWVKASDVCGSTTCSSVMPTALNVGGHQWYIQAYSGKGYSPWSSGLNFTVSATLPPTITKNTPLENATVTSTSITFRWAKNSNAHSYELYVIGPQGLTNYQKVNSTAHCSGSTCTLILPITKNGSYTWYLRGLNAAGAGPWSILNSAADNYGAVSFVVAAPSVGTVTKLAPAQSTILTSGTVDFRWQDTANATEYELYVGGPQGYVNYQIWARSTYCSSGTCTVRLTLPHNGDYFWYLRGKNAVNGGPWSPLNSAADNYGKATFKVNAAMVGTVSKTNPAANATLTNLTVQLSWQATVHATSYELYVGGPSGYSHYKMYFVGQNVTCTATCSVTLNVPYNGSYMWYLRGANAAGAGPWSPANNASDQWGARTFSVNVPAPNPNPVLLSPANGTVWTETSNVITFEWQSVQNATWYNFILTDGITIIKNLWYQRDAIDCQASCRISLGITVGSFKWTVLTWGPSSPSVIPYTSGVTPTFNLTRLET